METFTQRLFRRRGLVEGLVRPLVVSLATPESPGGGPVMDEFREGLRELGYQEGKNLVIEWRWAHGDAARLPDFAADLVRLKVDVIVAATSRAAVAAR